MSDEDEARKQSISRRIMEFCDARTSWSHFTKDELFELGCLNESDFDFIEQHDIDVGATEKPNGGSRVNLRLNGGNTHTFTESGDPVPLEIEMVSKRELADRFQKLINKGHCPAVILKFDVHTTLAAGRGSMKVAGSDVLTVISEIEPSWALSSMLRELIERLGGTVQIERAPSGDSWNSSYTLPEGSLGDCVYRVVYEILESDNETHSLSWEENSFAL